MLHGTSVGIGSAVQGLHNRQGIAIAYVTCSISVPMSQLDTLLEETEGLLRVTSHGWYRHYLC